MAEREGIYISQLPESTSLTDNMLFATDNGADNNSVSAAKLAEYVNKKIDVAGQVNNGVSEANSYTDTKKTEAVNETKEWTVGNFSRQNLLDNWYFANPINQRGKTEYTTSGYTIDRWTNYWGAKSVTLTDEGITLGAGNTTYWGQILEPQLANFLLGKTVTLSALLADGTLASDTKKLASTLSGINTMTPQISIGGRNFNLDYDSSLHPANTFALRSWQNSSNNIPTTVKAIKLELGSLQTLAHQENGVWVLNEVPNKALELLKCQRYFQTFATQSLRPTDALDFRPVMRTTPALGTITVNGKTLYTASADM